VCFLFFAPGFSLKKPRSKEKIFKKMVILFKKSSFLDSRHPYNHLYLVVSGPDATTY